MLFASGVAISLTILVVFFSLFFKDVDMTFQTHMPESAPTLEPVDGDDEGSDAFGNANVRLNLPPEEMTPRPVAPAAEPVIQPSTPSIDELQIDPLPPAPDVTQQPAGGREPQQQVEDDDMTLRN